MQQRTFARSAVHFVGASLLLAAASTPLVRAATGSWTAFGPQEGNLVSVAVSARGDLFAVAESGSIAEIWQLPAGASSWRWRNQGLGRPYVRALASHPTRPDELWAISGGAGQTLFRSTDAGASWQPTGTGPGGFLPGPASSLVLVVGLWVAPAPTVPVLFAETLTNGVDRELLRSTDGGASWTEVGGALGPVAAPPDQPQVVYAAAARGGRVLRSRNGGKTFQAFRPTGVRADDKLLALHATRGRTPMVFASFAAGGLFRSSGGTRWDRVGFAGFGPAALASDPHDARRVYAASAAGIYTSVRSGRPDSFTLREFLPQGVVGEARALVVAASGPLVLAGGDLRGPGAAVLAETGVLTFGVEEMRVAEANGELVALRRRLECTGPSCGVRTFLSSDGGATFQRLGFPVMPRVFADVYDLAFDPGDASRRLAIFGPGGLHLTDPQGSRWLEVRFGLGMISDSRIVEITGGGDLLVGGAYGILVSRDEGATWTLTLNTVLGSRRFVDLRADVGAPETVVAVALQLIDDPPKRVGFRSTDSGETWGPLLGGRPGLLDVEAVPGQPATFYVLVAGPEGSELQRSDDDGHTYGLVHTFPALQEVNDIAVGPFVTTDLYAASAGGVLRSRDGGATWDDSPGAPVAWGSYRRHIRNLWIDPTARGHLYAAPIDGGLFESRISSLF